METNQKNLLIYSLQLIDQLKNNDIAGINNTIVNINNITMEDTDKIDLKNTIVSYLYSVSANANLLNSAAIVVNGITCLNGYKEYLNSIITLKAIQFSDPDIITKLSALLDKVITTTPINGDTSDDLYIFYKSMINSVINTHDSVLIKKAIDKIQSL